VSERGLLAQLLLMPLVLAALSADAIFELSARRRHYIVVVLLVATLAALFFPTRAWAPQHSGALETTVRVILYFVAILLHDYISPPSVYVNLSAEPALNADVEVADEHRRSRIAQIFDAYERIDGETMRVREFIALSAWVLVTPLYLVLLVYPLAIAAAIYTGRRRVVDATEVVKLHPVPPPQQPPPPPLVVPLSPPQHMQSELTGDALPTRLVLPRNRRPAAVAFVPAAEPPPPTTPPPPAAAPSSTIVVKRTVY